MLLELGQRVDDVLFLGHGFVKDRFHLLLQLSVLRFQGR